MKLNPDCMRDILIFVENIEYGTQATFENICAALKNYTPEEIDYTANKLNEASLIDGLFLPELGHVGDKLARLNFLTYDGHEVLANIRNERI